ncbi:MAG: GNAT family N-acetyltransferase [Eubacteriales bacterium]|nr:GNAT family N-acetyltransferase [Eubacteriales bacterium]
MPEKLEIIPTPRLLDEAERKATRKLYQEAFPEDTGRFVDFYYQYKIRDNEILAVEEDGRFVSMIHLNPYRMIVNGYETPGNYIVAVATAKEYRRRGYMRALLEEALRKMGREKMPFTFLMPASERIYTPFDFVWICPFTELPPRVERMDADGQNRYLAQRYQVFCKRDARYMENLLAEREAEQGESSAGPIPPFMARITNVEQMLRLTSSMEERELYVKVKDETVSENDGCFYWKSGPEKSEAVRLPERPEHVDLELTVGELTSMVFQSFRICLSEAV